MRFTLCGARLVDAVTDVAQGNIQVNGSRIGLVSQTAETDGEMIDATDSIIVPGFIEIHTHGGGGFNLHTTSVEEIRSYARWVPVAGVTSFLIAVVGTPDALPIVQLATAVDAIELAQQEPTGAEPVGIFLEGPYINAKRRGAHPTNWLRTPNADETERILQLTHGYLRLVTLAPELLNAEAMIHRLVESGITVSMGHTDVDYEQAQSAIQTGITHLTHCFNAMRQMQHRAPGPIPAVVQSDHVMGELIADGIHVHPAMMDMLIRLLGPARTIAITDAQAGAGLEHAEFEFAGQKTHIADGAARLEDGTLAGSILTMDHALRNIMENASVTLSEAVGMLSLNPARAIHLDHEKSLLKEGYAADLLVFDKNLRLQATICRGQLVYAADNRLDHLKRLQGV
ncbi:MAG TPA: N-acetylglucosamine-6-phosphate deacetylase [Dictyobacter sp.]|nr:N-acetylglucosamine-6-phosphate deacetylase [Dictyobacter sp.]